MSEDRTVLEQQYGERVSKLVVASQQGNVDAFGALVLRDHTGDRIDMAPIHRSWSKFVKYCWQHEFYAGILAPWRHGKSLLCTIRFALMEMGINPESRIRIICADDDEAMLRVASVRRFLESWEYKVVYPNVRPARLGEWTRHRLFIERKSAGPDPTLDAAGIFTGEAGGGNDLILLDDIVTYMNSILHPTLRKQVYDTLTSVWLRRIDPKTRVVLVGTTWHAYDAYQLLRGQNSGQWRWLVQGVNSSFSGIDSVVE